MLLCLMGHGDTAGVHQCDLELGCPERRGWFVLCSAGLREAQGIAAFELCFRMSFWEKGVKDESALADCCKLCDFLKFMYVP